jgi:hypothetical protein
VIGYFFSFKEKKTSKIEEKDRKRDKITYKIVFSSGV